MSVFCKFRKFIYVFLFVIAYCAKGEITNVVDHKDAQLNLYLDFIRYNLQEKLGIMPYILKKGEGKYLEVGAGGDPIAFLLSKIPSEMSPIIIASDIDINVLDALPARHPELTKYLHSQVGPVLRLQQLDATSMDCFHDNELDGINASAVVHEIISYAGGMNGFESFFKEALRVLKPGGVLIYRDPEAVLDKKKMIVAHLKSSIMRLFAHIFLCKYLSKDPFSLVAREKKQVEYDSRDISFTFYKKSDDKQSCLSFNDYLALQSHTIDFMRPYSITMPNGLCREMERHYLTYLHQCNPLAFIKCIPVVGSDLFFVNYLAHSTASIFEEFLNSNRLSFDNSFIDILVKKKIEETIKLKGKVIEYGIPLLFTSATNERRMFALLKYYGFDPNHYIIPFKDHCYLLDYRIFGLLYDCFIDENIFDNVNGPLNKKDRVHAEWLKREGEESYIYYSDDALLAHVAELSFRESLKNSPEDIFLLCPVSAEQNKFIPRLCYEEVLREAIEVTDLEGYIQEIKEGKRIVHFSKIKLDEACGVLTDIISSDPERYVLLKKALDIIISVNMTSDAQHYE